MRNIFTQNLQYRLDHFHNNGIDNAGVHQHDFYEIFFFVSGTAYYIIHEERIRIAPGSILLIDRGVPHTPIVNPEHKKRYNRYVLSIAAPYMESLCTETTDLRRCFHAADGRVILLEPDTASYKKVIEYLRQLIEISSLRAYGYDVLRTMYMLQLLLLLNNLSLNISSHLEKSYIPRSLLIDSIADFIQQNFHRDLSLTEIAEHFFISESHLCHHFKAKMGITVNEYIREQRVEYAKLLLTRGMYVTETAKQCGFSDPSALYRVFKKLVGISPNQYRTQGMRNSSKREF